MRNKLLIIAAAITGLSACKSTEKMPVYDLAVNFDTIEITAAPLPSYKPERTRDFDLIHTQLDLSFDWQNQHVLGYAEVTVTPHLHEYNTVTLDAKGFEISQVQLLADSTPHELEYDYDGSQLMAHLPHSIGRHDTVKLAIHYVAKPNELESNYHGKAITSDKGLYFINPLNEDPNVPQQIWSQGETEANSAWFPTLDSPNQKHTQEIALTVDTNFVTLSNGLLDFQMLNGDGTRTDVWIMNKPHAPYLTMIAVGDYAIVKDSWRDSLAVDYYVEHKYAPYAHDIFGMTPEMMTFYSDILGVDFPWDKYSQIVVREYVSGAMENTSAVIFGDFAQKTKRELLDDSPEDVIAHELFHHWFGDLVTAESWANLAINESFATYGEYLWIEYKHGKMSADEHLDYDLFNYLNEFKYGKAEDIIRFHYEHADDMFDSHSYAKGGRVLHLLRDYLGDEVFFEGIQDFLNTYEFKKAEMHQLRLTFEDLTGEDLNWFFNQWFYSAGHPILEVKYDYNDSLKQQTVYIEQVQDITLYPVFQLPLTVDLYVDGQVERHDFTLSTLKDTLVFDVSSEPQLVNFDAKKVLLGEVNEQRSLESYIYQLDHAPLYKDKAVAIQMLQSFAASSEEANQALLNALDQSYGGTLYSILEGYQDMEPPTNLTWQSQVEALLQHPEANVRSIAVEVLGEYGSGEHMMELLKTQFKSDSSWSVIGASLFYISQYDVDWALKEAKSYEEEDEGDMLHWVTDLYAHYADITYADYFKNQLQNVQGYDIFTVGISYADYTARMNNKDLEDFMINFCKPRLKTGKWYDQYASSQMISIVIEALDLRVEEAQELYKMYHSGQNKNQEKAEEQQQLINDYTERIEQLIELIPE